MEWRHRLSCARVLLCGALWLALSSCSLLSVKSPERPLSPRDLNARILTRELSAQFVAAVSRSADDIAASEHDPRVLENTLRWEIAAVGASRHAATRLAPMMSLLDTWALAAQMQAFTDAGAPGGALFGAHQQLVRDLCGQYASESQALARRLLAPHDFATYQAFVDKYVREHPLADLTFARPSMVELWSREQGSDTRLVDSLGTIPEAMADAADRMEIYGDTVPAQLMHETELALREAGYSRGDLQAATRELRERLERLSAVAESTPALVRDAEAQVRQSLREVLDRLEASSRNAEQALHAERVALFADLQSERSAVMAQLDVERKAVAEDAARISGRVVQDTGTQLRELAAEVLLLLIVLAVVVLGLPFAAGYLVGRARAARAGP
ncbi:MAG TPA: hypothetical protein VEH00_14790 [Steroidobacteraceae bacterium]|nr:hypothetical protein [Steroidobacteraceae bacterium]